MRRCTLGLCLVSACGAGDGQPWGTLGGGTGTDTSPETEGGTTTTGPDGADHGDSGTAEGPQGPKFDLGAPDTPGAGPSIIPETCQAAEEGESTVGCLFFTVDLDQHSTGMFELAQYAVAVSNVQLDQAATIVIEEKVGEDWMEVYAPQIVEPLDLLTIPLPDNHQHGSGVRPGGSYRITSDVPIIAYQFNPLVLSGRTSEASLLYPVSSWDTLHDVVQWGEGWGNAYATVVAAVDGTVVEVTPSIPTASGPGVPAGSPGTPLQIELDEGDIAEVMVEAQHAHLTGTRIESNDEHPIAVFSGHECGEIPYGVGACDHLEEQLAGLRLWGTSFVASRVPVRRPGQPEASLWQVYASEDDTVVDIEAAPAVTGLPAMPVELDRGQKLEFLAGGDAGDPGDFAVEANKPITVVNYMTSMGNIPDSVDGDPAMIQLSPIEQYLPRYVVLVPPTWARDFLVVTRPEGAQILIDDMPAEDSAFVPVGDSGYEVARIEVPDGVHVLDGGTARFQVLVVGYDDYDSYGYLGGTGTGVINQEPEG